jgi:hypothetical protein
LRDNGTLKTASAAGNRSGHQHRRKEPKALHSVYLILAKRTGKSMEHAPFDRRQQHRQIQQQQPQQIALYPTNSTATQNRVTQESSRRNWQSLANAQAKEQSGKL